MRSEEKTSKPFNLHVACFYTMIWLCQIVTRDSISSFDFELYFSWSRAESLYRAMFRNASENRWKLRKSVNLLSWTSLGNVWVTAPNQAMLWISVLEQAMQVTRLIFGYSPTFPRQCVFPLKVYQRRIPAVGYELNYRLFARLQLSLNNLNCVISSHLLKNVPQFSDGILKSQTVSGFPEIKEDFCWWKNFPTLNP